MSNEQQVGADSGSTPQETSALVGQSVQEPEVAGGESQAEGSQTAGEPTGEGLAEKGKPDLEKQYKEIQSAYTKGQEKLKAYEQQISMLQQYGGPEKIAQWAQFLQSDPGFAQWLQQRQQEVVAGVKTDDMDDDTRRALEIVQNVSKQTTQAMTQKLLNEHIKPLADKLKNKLIEETFMEMDKLNPGWRELQDEMAKLSDRLPPEVQDNPSLEDIQDLYLMAARRTGKFDEIAAKTYNKQLEEKKQKSTAKPASSGSDSQPKPAKSMKEAYEQAKKSLGVGFS